MADNKESVYFQTIRNFLGPILPLLEDEKITEVMINGPNQIWIEVAGKIQKTTAKFQDEDSLRAAVNNIAQSVGRRINDEEPRLDARLPNGYRIHAVIPPCARNGTTLAIRKFSRTQFTFKDYIRMGAMSVDVAQFLDIAMKLGKNILVSGGTGSGKTTLLSVLCNRIPAGQRLIVIEDSTELQIEYEHVVFFETRMPDRIVVGEVRGAEALELVQAMNTGHKGCLGTIHANSSSDALVRLEALAQGGDSNLSEKALRYQIGAAIDIVVQISRYPDGSRRVGEVSEVLGWDKDGTYNVAPIYLLGRMQKRPDGSLVGSLQPTGELPTFMEEIEDNQIPFPRTKFARAA
jgi:pilus assembly protein CpaF